MAVKTKAWDAAEFLATDEHVRRISMRPLQPAMRPASPLRSEAWHVLATSARWRSKRGCLGRRSIKRFLRLGTRRWPR